MVHQGLDDNVLAWDVPHTAELCLDMGKTRQCGRVQPATDAVAVFEKADLRFGLCLLESPGTVCAGDTAPYYGYFEIHRFTLLRWCCSYSLRARVQYCNNLQI